MPRFSHDPLWKKAMEATLRNVEAKPSSPSKAKDEGEKPPVSNLCEDCGSEVSYCHCKDLKPTRAETVEDKEYDTEYPGVHGITAPDLTREENKSRDSSLEDTQYASMEDAQAKLDPDGKKHAYTYKCLCGNSMTCRCGNHKQVVMVGTCDRCEATDVKE